MSIATVVFLARRLRRAEQRWDFAMAREGYRDDPEDGPPFSEQEWTLYGWADNWRLLVHRLENELDSIPEFRHHQAKEAVFVCPSEPTIYVSELSVSALAASTANLRASQPENKRNRR